MTDSVPRTLASRIVRMLPREAIGRLVGRACDAPLSPSVSRAAVEAFCRLARVDMADVQPRSSPYESLDAFFTRPLRPGSRPVCEGSGEVASPADGLLQSAGSIERGCRILVKNRAYDVARLVGDEREACALVGGKFAVVYLSPRDYHRLHAPVSGSVVLVRGIPGELYPVNSVGEKCTRSLLVENKRVVIVIETKDIGRVILVLVGAMVVGRITVCMLPNEDVPAGVRVIDPPNDVARGDELGAFHLGSTAVVLTGPESCSWQRQAGPIRVGESLMRFG